MSCYQKKSMLKFKIKYMKKKNFFILIIFFLIVLLNVINANNLSKILFVEEKFIQYECSENDICGGWADRLKGLMSTFAFSLITDRTFLIKMTKNCDLKNILEPNEINWDHNIIVSKKISSKVLKYAWNYALSDQFKKEKEILSNETDNSLLIVKSGFMFSDALSENPNFTEKIKKLGYNQTKFKIAYLFKEWYKKLFKLNNRLEKKLEKFLKKLKPLNNSKVICAQVRMGDPGHIGQTDVNASVNFWHFINKTFLQSKYSNQYSINITSDTEQIKQEGKNFFVNHNVFYNDKSSNHVEIKSQENGCQSLENVIFDFHLMQYCDIGVVSHSGFGILSMWNRPDPFKNLYVYTKKNQKKFKNDYWNRKNLTFLKYSNLNDIYFI